MLILRQNRRFGKIKTPARNLIFPAGACILHHGYVSTLRDLDLGLRLQTPSNDWAHRLRRTAFQMAWSLRPHSRLIRLSAQHRSLASPTSVLIMSNIFSLGTFLGLVLFFRDRFVWDVGGCD